MKSKVLVNSKVLGLFLILMLGVMFTCGRSVSAADKHPYLIKVNKERCTVTVYEKDKKGKYTKPIKAMLCSPGNATPVGTFHTPAKYRWHVLMGPCYGQYCTRITGGVLFHSVWYYSQSPATLSYQQFNNLGTRCSHGCVRLCTRDAKWIYDNCSLGTTVVVYNSSNPGPLGRPKMIKVPSYKKMGYDPTDAWSKGNPYIKTKPKIKGASDKKVKYGKKFDVRKGVKAKNSAGEDSTSRIEITITYKGKTVKKINTKKAGTYKVRYEFTDEMGRTASKTIKVKVVDTTPPVIKGVADMTLSGKDASGKAISLNKAFLLKNVSATWHGKKLKKSVIQTVLKETTTATMPKGLRRFQATYSVTTSNHTKAKKVATIYMDTQAPVLYGVKNQTIAQKNVVNNTLSREFVLQGISVKDNYSNLHQGDIKVSVGAYIEETKSFAVTYTVKDKVGNTTIQTAVFTVLEDTPTVSPAPNGSPDPTDN